MTYVYNIILYLLFIIQTPLKQNDQELDSDIESSISLGEVEYISGVHNNRDSDSSVGEIKN